MKRNFLAFVVALSTILACQNDPTPSPNPVTPGEKVFSTGYKKDPNAVYGKVHFNAAPKKAPMPESFDWEEQGFKTPLRNQGDCGSCWAFATVQTLEGAAKIYLGIDIDLAEQDLVGKLFYGCGGGWYAGDYIVKYGVPDEASCKYRATNYKCAASFKAAMKAVRWAKAGAPNRKPTVEETQVAIQTFGYVSATVGANSSFMNMGGVATSCPASGTNHMVALVGWKTINGKVHFKIKNSWGTSWGNEGYSYVPLGCYNLGEEIEYAVVESQPCTPPAVRLPAEYVLHFGDEVLLGVKEQKDVTYAWYADGKLLGEKPLLELLAKDTMHLTLKAKNHCGAAEVLTQVTVR